MNLAFSLYVLKNKIFGSLFPQRTADIAKNTFLTPRKYPLKPWEQEIEQRAERFSFGEGLSALRWGDAKPKILLVHGWESRATQMSGFVDLFIELGYQVIAMDAPAHGQSKGVRANPVAFAEAIVSAHSELGPFEAIVGHSMGGSALAIALSEGVSCKKAVLISSPSTILGVLKSFSNFIGLPTKCGHIFIRLVGESAGRPAAALDVTKISKTFTATSLIIHDENDFEIPFENAKAIQGSWPNAELMATQGFGHRAILRQGVVWKAIADFVGAPNNQ